MKKRMISIVAVLALIFSISAQAATPRAVQTSPSLRFSGTTAYCSADVSSGNSKDSIEVTMTLWSGSTSVATWKGSGTSNVFLSKTCAAVKGRTYKLTVDVTINGSALAQKSVSATCY